MDKRSFKLLKLFSSRNSLSLEGLSAIYNTDIDSFCSPVRYLMDEGFLQIEPNHSSLHGDDFTFNAPISITHSGRVALENEMKERKHFYFNELRSCITIFISVSALLLSLFSLYLQYK